MTADQRRQPRQARSEARVTAILAAARALLQEGEGADLSVRAVAARAEMSPASVYRYFDDVDQVVDALLVEHAELAERTVAEALAASRHRSVAGVFELVVRTYLDLYERRPELTVAWASPVLADRQRAIEERSDASLAVTVGRHLVERGILAELTSWDEERLVAQWTTAGALLGVVLRAEPSRRDDLTTELLALVRHLASRWRGDPVAAARWRWPDDPVSGRM